ncbi:odorant receptor Or2-like [Danaus plexippus]|uniref:odorant receptor Or2-like n=1 Tax=Danaus plexippus TaxID=13037 RepID=UPI002AB15E25|nr:odorant receptor Or2-like [Danaus plexippus]
MYWNVMFCNGNLAFIFKCIVPVAASYLFSSYEIKLPTSNYFFLSDDFKNDYFMLIFFYQSFGIYGLMVYDISIHTFVNGFLSFAITQLKILNYKFSTFKSERDSKFNKYEIERINMMKLKQMLKHYDNILKYCKGIQDIFNVTLFVQYIMSSLVICFVCCGLLLPLTKEQYAFVFAYLFGMVIQIFAPSFLGTLITYQNQELVFAAYNSDWFARSESFKRSIKIFMVRTNTPVVIDGLKLFPLSLETFTSIMKTAYSFMTLVRNMQNESNIP